MWGTGRGRCLPGVHGPGVGPCERRRTRLVDRREQRVDHYRKRKTFGLPIRLRETKLSVMESRKIPTLSRPSRLPRGRVVPDGAAPVRLCPCALACAPSPLFDLDCSLASGGDVEEAIYSAVPTGLGRFQMHFSPALTCRAILCRPLRLRSGQALRGWAQ